MFEDFDKVTQGIIRNRKLNKELLVKNNITEENILKMEYYHTKIDKLFDLSYRLEKTNLSEKQYKKEAKMIGKELEKTEKQLQKLWGFEYNPNYFNYWNSLTGCKCPIFDNYENKGIRRIINCKCAYHNFLCK